MPTATKKSRPRIKIEETTDEPVLSAEKSTEADNSETENKEKEVVKQRVESIDTKVEKTPKTDEQIPSITSFAQLDVPPVVHSDTSKTPPSEDKETQADTDNPLPAIIQDVPAPTESTPDLPVDKTESKTQVPSGNSLSSEEVKEWLKDVRPDTTKEVSKSSSDGFSWGKVFFVAIFVIALGALAGGVYYYQSTTTSKSGEIAHTPTPTMSPMGETPTPEVTVTPTPDPDFDLSTLTISILNGSGIAGEAGRANALLEKAGFKKATTGNAASFDFTDTEVRMKSSVPDSVFETIKTALEVNYKSVVKVSRAISDKDKNDIEITLGEKK